MCPEVYSSFLQVRKQIDEIDDYRPYFTWWVTTVQIFILFLSILCYGIAPYGVSLSQQHGQVSFNPLLLGKSFYLGLLYSQVLMTSLSIQTVDYWEPENLWFGPRAVREFWEI